MLQILNMNKPYNLIFNLNSLYDDLIKKYNLLH